MGEQPIRGGGAAMKRKKLNYRFHDPNDPAVTAEYLLKIFIEANSDKVRKIIEDNLNKEMETEKRGRYEI